MITLDNFIHSKKIKIYQKEDGFKYNMDSILLANFVASHYKRGNIIDLATGNIPIPLYLYYRLKKEITAVELQRDIYQLGRKTIEYNHLEPFIHLFCEDIRNVKKQFLTNSFSVVVCNPPYFSVKDNYKLAEERRKAIARHEVTLTIEDIVIQSKYLLNNQGSLFLIYRTERMIELFSLLHKNNLEPKVIRMIHSRKEKAAKLFLIEARLNAHAGCIIEKPLIVYENGNVYTKEIITMFGDDEDDTKKL